MVNSMKNKYVGVWPVMLTPFNEQRSVDYNALENLIDWYVKAGVHGLFGLCQSSEMFFLSDKESQKIAKFIIEKVDGKIPVVVSGHTATDFSHQSEQLIAMSETGADSIILISNRFALQGEDNKIALNNLQKLVQTLPQKIDLGIYECPYPYKRLLSDDIVKWCVDSKRFTFIKDTCCDLNIIKQRALITNGSRLSLANANSQTLLTSLQMGYRAFSGVMANFHPELYVWLYENWEKNIEKAQILSSYLSTAALVENLDYPICAKYYQQKIGNFSTIQCRVRTSQNFMSSFYPQAIDDMVLLGEIITRSLAI